MTTDLAQLFAPHMERLKPWLPDYFNIHTDRTKKYDSRPTFGNKSLDTPNA